jgi:hypothetical protein
VQISNCNQQIIPLAQIIFQITHKTSSEGNKNITITKMYIWMIKIMNQRWINLAFKIIISK